MGALDAAARTANRLRALGFVPLRVGHPPVDHAMQSRAAVLQARAAPEDTGGEGVWYAGVVLPRLRAARCDGLAIEANTGYRAGESSPMAVTWVPRWVALVVTFAKDDTMLKDLLFRLQKRTNEQQALEAALALGGDVGFTEYLESIL